jgi:conserved hypothetical protein
MERMKKRVYGIIGVSSLMSNWNADFTGNPKSTLDGRIFGSDKALKYSFRKLWNDQGRKVLYFKTLKKDNLQPMELDEKYEELFGEGEKSGSKKAKGDKELIVLSNLFNTVDGKQFGITFPSKKYSQFSVTGAVQIKQGFNFYKNTVNIQDVLSPFKNSNNKDADNSSIGKMIFTDETHYFYPFIINPMAYKEYENLGLTNGYTEEDYKLFKETALKSVTALNSASKFGCSNEFALFIETDEFLDMPVIDRFLSYEKRTNESKAKIKFNLNSVLELYKKDIKKVEVYYNPDFIEFETDLENVETFIL